MTNCTHALANGQHCNAPALNGSAFCRHHDPRRPRREVQEESREAASLVLPLLHDKPSVLTALNELIQAIANDRIRHSEATTLLSGIKLAARLIREIEAAALAKSAGQNLPDSTLLHSGERHNGAPAQIPARQKETAAHPKPRSSGQTVTHLAASRDPRISPALSHTPPVRTDDLFIEQLMAQSQQLLAGSPRPDSRFLRA